MESSFKDKVRPYPYVLGVVSRKSALCGIFKMSIFSGSFALDPRGLVDPGWTHNRARLSGRGVAIRGEMSLALSKGPAEHLNGVLR